MLVKAGTKIEKKGGKDPKQTALNLASSSEVSEILLEALKRDQNEIGGGSEGGTVSKEGHHNNGQEFTVKHYCSYDKRVKACVSN